MKQLLTAINFSTVICILLAGCSPSEQTATLRYKYQAGAQFEYTQLAMRHMEIYEKDSVLQKSNSKIVTGVKQVVRRMLEDSTAEVLEQLSWDIVVPNKEDTTRLDTLHDTREMIVYLKPRGTIVDMEFISKVDSTERQYLREYYEQGFMVFPEEPVNEGYVWTQSVDVQLGDTTATASTSFTVQGFDILKGYEVVTIGYDGMLIIPVHESPTDTLKRSGLDRIHMQGVLSFAPTDGIVVGMTEKWELDGDRRRLKDGNFTQFKIRGTMDVTYELVTYSPPR
ncbi:MAG: hypothetical protein NDJ18_04730 [candidate division Zixibacteria bacterium]|nr:hypothetical protein [candidate division Zixibacteria bacterium]